MRVAFSGSRAFDDRSLVGDEVERVVNLGHFIHVGDAPAGVDLFVRLWVQSLEAELELEQGHLCRVFVADWTRLGRAAGHHRNESMLAQSDALIAMFATGSPTPGTSDAVETAARLGLPRKVWRDGRWSVSR